MPSQFMFVIVVLGAVAVTAQNDTDLPTDPAKIPQTYLTFQTKVDGICTKTLKTLWDLEENFRKEMRHTLTVMMKDVEGMLLLPRTASRTLTMFFRRTRNAMAIESCLKGQQLYFRTELMSQFQKVTQCVVNVSHSALHNIRKTRQNFTDISCPGSSVSYIMENEWDSCLNCKSVLECIESSLGEINTKITDTETEGSTALDVSKMIIEEGRKAINVCLQSQDDFLEYMWNKHAKLIGTCIVNPKQELRE